MARLRIGILALQGCVRPHKIHIEGLGAELQEIRREEELDSIHGLILPGGESTTMLKLIDAFRLENALRSTFRRVPVWGICAGAILMARQVRSPGQRSFDLLDIEVERNSYGRQLESFDASVEDYPVALIRAPRILSAGKDVRIRAAIAGSPVWVQSGRYMATTFHPELNRHAPSPMHRSFVELCEAGSNQGISFTRSPRKTQIT